MIANIHWVACFVSGTVLFCKFINLLDIYHINLGDQHDYYTYFIDEQIKVEGIKQLP